MIDSQPHTQNEIDHDEVTNIAHKNTSGANKDDEKTVMRNSSEQSREEQEHIPSGSVLEQPESLADPTSATSSSGISVANVQSIRQTLQDTQVEPVISFQYHSEGTTASTISVDFEAMQGIRCLPSSSDDVRPSEIKDISCTVASDRDDKTTTGEIGKDLPCESQQVKELSIDNDSVKIATVDPLAVCEKAECQISNEEESDQSTDCKGTSQISNERPTSSSDLLHDVKQSETAVSECDDVQQRSFQDIISDPLVPSNQPGGETNVPVERSSVHEADDSYDEVYICNIFP